MLALLRKVRRSIMESGSTRKYLLYACGEVLLVMIGILLALQINNWNEAGKTRNLELKLLAEIKIALENDKNIHLERLMQRSNLWVKECNDLIHVLDHDLPYHDSLGRKFHVLTSAAGTGFSTGAYNSLESVGIQIVRNDELRNRLVALYTQHIPGLETGFQNSRSNVLNFGRPLIRTEFKHLGETYVPVDFDRLRQDVLLYNVLKSIRNNNMSLQDDLRQTVDRIDGIITLIEEEFGEN